MSSLSTTSEILDNAQGYGYKSVQKAYAAYCYKHRSIKEIEREQVAKKLVKEWCKTHREFCSFMSGVVWENPDRKDYWKICGEIVERARNYRCTIYRQRVFKIRRTEIMKLLINDREDSEIILFYHISCIFQISE